MFAFGLRDPGDLFGLNYWRPPGYVEEEIRPILHELSVLPLDTQRFDKLIEWIVVQYVIAEAFQQPLTALIAYFGGLR
ncbi:hypothetical protein BX661DRAFT_187917, partial [Kickxella alabastrina]|uniref:uncharacterized protein n=1 Tax=Kickxella alabastrina TaxID=61397 RepID=UPI00221E672C